MSRLVLVVPCYNEEKRLDVEAFRAYRGAEFLFVNDGSGDSKQKRKAEHIAEGYEDRGVPDRGFTGARRVDPESGRPHCGMRAQAAPPTRGASAFMISARVWVTKT